jgi:hypothetical protein
MSLALSARLSRGATDIRLPIFLGIELGAGTRFRVCQRQPLNVCFAPRGHSRPFCPVAAVQTEAAIDPDVAFVRAGGATRLQAYHPMVGCEREVERSEMPLRASLGAHVWFGWPLVTKSLPCLSAIG